MRPNVLKAWRVAKMGKGVMPQPKAAPLPDNLSTLKRAELVDLAESRGIAVDEYDTKRQIVEALNG